MPRQGQKHKFLVSVKGERRRGGQGEPPDGDVGQTPGKRQVDGRKNG